MKKTLVFLTMLVAFTSVNAQPEADQQLQDRLRAHIEFLAADELLGREPGTKGYEMAADYVAGQFREMGLVPAGSKESYFQPVPLRRAYLEEGSATMSLHRDGQSQAFEMIKEFYRGPSVTHTSNEFSAEMVFAGYGIDAPELDYTDFESIDLTGKIAVTLGGQPKSFPSEEGAHFASNREKARALVAHGAVGWVIIYTPRNEKLFGWARIKNMEGKAAMDWLTEAGNPFAGLVELKGGAVVHYTPAAALFKGSDHSLKALIAMDERGENPPVFPLDGTLSLEQKSRHETIHSPNVAALLPGTDPLLSDEYLVYSAHLDHIGELHGDGHEDAINNGAMDNASGVSVMLETARMFAQAGGTRRSIIFLAVTAEEKGLLGAEYFAQNPTVPEGSLVANINLDMPILLWEFGDVIAFGAEHSSLGGLVEQAAAEFDVTLSPDPMPERNIFVRSDHYRFVQQGVPSVYLITGSSSLNKEEDNGPLMQSFIRDHYHQPTDDLNLAINYKAAARFTKINARTGEIIANRTERPTWNEGDFFGTTFSR
jgi:hypothetical protein